MSNKAPSAGKKVTTGENIPTTREAPGNVPQDSLAAESARKGGTFASNPGQGQGQGEQGPQKRQQQQHTQEGSATTAPSKTTSVHLENQQSSRGTSTNTGQQTSGQQQQQQRQQGAVLGARGASPPQGTARQTTINLEKQGGPAPSAYATTARQRDPAGPHGKNLTEGGFEGSGTEAGPLPEPGSEQDPARAATSEMRAGLRTGAGGKEGVKEGTGSWYTPLGGDEPA